MAFWNFWIEFYVQAGAVLVLRKVFTMANPCHFWGVTAWSGGFYYGDWRSFQKLSSVSLSFSLSPYLVLLGARLGAIRTQK